MRTPLRENCLTRSQPAVPRALGVGLFALCFVGACTSTETGNPPVIMGEAIAFRRVDDTMIVEGGRGAVSPAGSVVEVANVSQAGEPVRGKVAADGSFSVQLNGSEQDTFSIRAIAPSGAATTISLSAESAADSGSSDAAASAASAPTVPDASAAQPNDAGMPRAGQVQATPASDAGMATSMPSDAGEPSLAAAANAPLRDAGGASRSCQVQETDITAALDHAVEIADKACAVDSDCVSLLSATLTSCHLYCTDSVASAKGAADVRAAVAAIESGACPAFNADGCMPAEGPCPPTLTQATCSQGSCTVGTGRVLSCSAQQNQADQQLKLAVDNADTTCTSAADCVSVSTATSCHVSCPAQRGIARTALASFTAALKQIDDGACAVFRNQGCATVSDACSDPSGDPTCVAGRCTSQ
jgi:hypothetical protein